MKIWKIYIRKKLFEPPLQGMHLMVSLEQEQFVYGLKLSITLLPQIRFSRISLLVTQIFKNVLQRLRIFQILQQCEHFYISEKFWEFSLVYFWCITITCFKKRWLKTSSFVKTDHGFRSSRISRTNMIL